MLDPAIMDSVKRTGSSPPQSPTCTVTESACRSAWARLIAKIHEVDPLLCPQCGATMKVIAVLERPPLVPQILDHLGLPTAAPSFRVPLDPPDGLPAGPPREWSHEPLFDHPPTPIRPACPV